MCRCTFQKTLAFVAVSKCLLKLLQIVTKFCLPKKIMKNQWNETELNFIQQCLLHSTVNFIAKRSHHCEISPKIFTDSEIQFARFVFDFKFVISNRCY